MKKLKSPKVMTLLELQREVNRLWRRLEMTHHYVSGPDGKMKRVRGYCGYDAIDCRDETIRLLQKLVDCSAMSSNPGTKRIK